MIISIAIITRNQEKPLIAVIGKIEFTIAIDFKRIISITFQTLGCQLAPKQYH